MSAIDYEVLLDDGTTRVNPVELARMMRALLSQNSGAAVNSMIVKQTSGLLFGLTASSSLGAAQFIQLFDASALPSDGVVPTLVFPVATTNVLTVNYIPPRAFRNGIIICNSTTQNTKTIGAANTIFDVQYL